MVSLEFSRILDKCSKGINLERIECEYLISLDENSSEVDSLILTASDFIRHKYGDTCIIGAQIGTIIGPCHADCAFCAFASSTTDIDSYAMDPLRLTKYLSDIAKSGVVSRVSLMTIHDFSFADLLAQVKCARKSLPASVALAINTGDLSLSECRSLFDEGVRFAYHSIRLGESLDNFLEPKDRFDTIQNLISSGIQVYSGIEPLGPEHTPKEISDAYYNYYEMGCFACSASPRVNVPNSRMKLYPSISERRLLQIRSALLLSIQDSHETGNPFYGGFYGGFNQYYAEYSSSPKDLDEFSEYGMKHTVDWCIEKAKSDGYSQVLRPDGSHSIFDSSK